MQAWALQDCVRDKSGHATPPCAAATLTARVENCAPPPHDLSHADQSEQSETTQLTGKGEELHWREADKSDGHGVPPNAAGVMTERDWD